MNSPGAHRLRLLLAFLSIYLIWGSTYLAIRFAIETMPPFLMAAARWIPPGLGFLAYAMWRDGARWPGVRPAVSSGIVGILLLVGGNGLVTWAEQWVPSGLTALLVATIPLWMAFLEWLQCRLQGRPKSLAPRSLAGLFLGFLGVGILMSDSFSGAKEASSSNTFVGSLALLVAAFLWAVGSLFARSAELPRSRSQSTGLQMLIGGIVLLVLGTSKGEWNGFDPTAISAKSLLALGYLICFGSVLGYSAYAWLLQVTQPSKVATYAYVNPVVAVLLGWLLGGEELTMQVMLAAGTIVISVILMTSAKDRTGPGTNRATPVPTPSAGEQ